VCEEAVVHRYGMGLELGVSPIPVPRDEADPCRGRAHGTPAGEPAAVGTTETDEGERDGRQ